MSLGYRFYPLAHFRQWIKDIYQNNLLAKNEMRIKEISGRDNYATDDHNIIDLSKVTVRLLNIVAEEDHLVAPHPMH